MTGSLDVIQAQQAVAAAAATPINSLYARNATTAQGGVERARGGVIAAEREGQATQSATVKVHTFPGNTCKGHVDGATGVRFSLLPPDNATGNDVKVVERVSVKDEGEDSGRQFAPCMSVLPTICTR